MTHQRVAAAAGVGRATVYRHWPRPEALLHDAMSQASLPFFTDPQGDLRPWLRQQLRRLADELALPTVRQMTATLIQTAQWDPAAREQLDRWLRTTAQRLQSALATADTTDHHDDPESLAALILGPLVYRTVLQAGTVTDDLLDHIVDDALPPAGRHDRTR